MQIKPFPHRRRLFVVAAMAEGSSRPFPWTACLLKVLLILLYRDKMNLHVQTPISLHDRTIK